MISGTVGAGAVSEIFTVTLTDANGVIATKSLTITVNAAPTITQASPLTAGTHGQSYTPVTFTETGGTTTLTWTATGVPAGMTLSTAGVLSGTPTTAGSYTLHVTLTDANGVVAAKTLSLTVN